MSQSVTSPHHKSWLHGLLPLQLSAGRRERLLGTAGAALGLLITALCCRAGGGSPWLIAPMGASAVLLFAVPASPLAQPWAMLAGNLVSALIGVSCARWIDDPAMAASLAGALAIAAMFQLRCLHPPGGAVAVTAVLGGPVIHEMAYRFVLYPVLLNSLLLLAVALLFNNALKRRYPHLPQEIANPHHTVDPLPSQRGGVSPEDLHQALESFGEVLDISEDDLAAILMAAEQKAQQRRLGAIRCMDIMSRDVVSTGPDASLQQAWDLLAHHKIKALPVVDASSRLLGMLSLHDFFLSGQDSPPAAPRMQGRVADIMSQPARSLQADQSITQLAQAFTDGGMHHMPVRDANDKLCGMITQSDLLAYVLKHSNM